MMSVQPQQHPSMTQSYQPPPTYNQNPYQPVYHNPYGMHNPYNQPPPNYNYDPYNQPPYNQPYGQYGGYGQYGQGPYNQGPYGQPPNYGPNGGYNGYMGGSTGNRWGRKQ